MDDLFWRQAGSRLVEDDDAGIVVDCPRDFYHLAFRGAEHPHRGRRIDVKVQRLQQLLRLDVQFFEAGDQLFAAEFDILRGRHRRHQAGFLIDHADTGCERIARALEIDRPAIDVVLARSQLDGTGDRLAQGRFPCPVLSDQGMHFARIKVEVHRFDGVYATVGLAAVHDAQHRIGGGPGDSGPAGGGGPRRNQNPAHTLLLVMSSRTRPLPLEMITSPCDV